MEFYKGDKVFLKVSPMKGVIRFGNRGKLNPCYIVPFKILGRFGLVAYRLALTLDLENVHDVFHVSMLRCYISDPSHIIVRSTIEIEKNLSYEEWPVRILDQQEKRLRNKVIPIVKIWWENQSGNKATLEKEADMLPKYPQLFAWGKYLTYLYIYALRLRTNFLKVGEDVRTRPIIIELNNIYMPLIFLRDNYSMHRVKWTQNMNSCLRIKKHKFCHA